MPGNASLLRASLGPERGQRNGQELWTACPDLSRGDLGLGLVWPLDEQSFLELGPCPDQGDQVRAVDVAPAFAGRLDELEHHRQPGRPGAWSLGDLGPQSDRREGRLERVGRFEVD